MNRTLALIVAAVCALTGLTAATIQTASAAAECIGAPAGSPSTYNEQRSFVENQAWWMPTGTQPDNSTTHHGHAHMGVCIPERETISSGNINFNVRVMLHDNPGKWNYVSMVFKGTDYETTVQKCYVRATMTNYTCPAANSSTGKGDLTCAQPGNCERWLTFSMPISAFNHSGLQEVRFRGYVPEPGSKEMRTNLNFQVYIQNGKSTANVTREPGLRGKGWYTGSLYCESMYNSVPIPDAPVSGVWAPNVDLTTHSSDASLPVTHSFVSLDPDFHAMPPARGTVLHDADGGFGPAALSIDTTTLTNGVHKLYLKADCRDDAQASTNSGVLVVPFPVTN